MQSDREISSSVYSRSSVIPQEPVLIKNRQKISLAMNFSFTQLLKRISVKKGARKPPNFFKFICKRILMGKNTDSLWVNNWKHL